MRIRRDITRPQTREEALQIDAIEEKPPLRIASWKCGNLISYS